MKFRNLACVLIVSSILISCIQKNPETTPGYIPENPTEEYFEPFPDYDYDIPDPDNPKSPDKIYVYLKFTGESEKGGFTAINTNKNPCYPRQLHLELNGKHINFYGYNPLYEKHIDQIDLYKDADLDRLHYDYYTGFSNYEGTEMYCGVYINDSTMAVSKSVKNPTIKFETLAVVDSKETGVMGLGNIEFFRKNSQHPLSITVPTSTFNEKVHSNKAYFTVNCLPDKQNSENNFEDVEITFDGFGKKE